MDYLTSKNLIGPEIVAHIKSTIEWENKPVRKLSYARSFGNGVELIYMNKFIEMGATFCKTSRNTSRMLDACKVDLNFLPVLIQIKAGYNAGLSATAILKDMKGELLKNYPEFDPIHNMPKVLIHHKDKPPEQKKRSEFESIVSMTYEDWTKLYITYFNKIENDNKNAKRTD